MMWVGVWGKRSGVSRCCSMLMINFLMEKCLHCKQHGGLSVCDEGDSLVPERPTLTAWLHSDEPNLRYCKHISLKLDLFQESLNLICLLDYVGLITKTNKINQKTKQKT